MVEVLFSFLNVRKKQCHLKQPQSFSQIVAVASVRVAEGILLAHMAKRMWVGGQT